MRLLDFARQPHVPWFIMQRLKMYSPKAYHLLRFGTLNVNTAQHWDEAWTRHGQDGFRASGELQVIRHRVIELVPQNAVVLDVGCGGGELLALLQQEKSCQCFGVDISAIAVGKVKERGFEGHVTSLPAIPYAAETFDVVVCTETLEHLSNPKGTIAEIARVVHASGTVLISVPDGRTDQEETHVHRFTIDSLHAMLSRHLDVESIDVIPEDNYQTLFARATKR